ncbi:hypothetical protein SAMD00023353_4600340 [Rosellinia necatrix]|uniref:Uncharacterized protein n=1 Tax=Rosellinia necatrix TaxID=77044 RepID=A0A1W2TPG1_ROSNE|nr:hypothetical protein SAMD00023353_4600340 [Rosellinia necatrix]
MAGVNTESVAKAPIASTETEAPKTTDNLPPITKETIDTAEASMVPSASVELTAKEAPVAPSVDTVEKQAATSTETKEDSTNKPSESGAPDSQPEKPSDLTHSPEPQPAETVASGVESGAPVNPSDSATAPLKPVSPKEIRDEGLPDADASEPQKPTAEEQKTDGVDSTPVENGNGTTNNKRKAETAEEATKSEANSAKDENIERPEKKLKTNGATTNGAARKPGRPRKEKNSVPAVGRTARKTRSQGAAD